MNAWSSESRQTCLDGRVVTGKDKVNEANPQPMEQREQSRTY